MTNDSVMKLRISQCRKRKKTRQVNVVIKTTKMQEQEVQVKVPVTDCIADSKENKTIAS